MSAMRIVVTGATGNVGTALVRALLDDPAGHEVIGIARRLPSWTPGGSLQWVQADVARDDLRPSFRGADAVVHLAWLLQPSRDRQITDAVNIEGSRRVFDAAIAEEVPAIVHASSVAAYRAGDPNVPVSEDWPTDGITGSYYSEQKVAVERYLDVLEASHPEVRVVRLRPGLIFQRSNASQFRRLFAGPFVPGSLLRPAFIPLIPQMPGLAGQVLHADDVAELYRLACTSPGARGPYNAATNPPLDAQSLGHMLGARPIGFPPRLARAVVKLTWRAHLQPVSAGWLDIALGVPIIKTDRARKELGWTPKHDAEAVIRELLDGLHEGDGFPTPPLEPNAGGRFRLREVLTGVGGPNPEDRRSVSRLR